ncbi:ATP-binding protein [Streptomyces sp. MST-110588]|uniref:sensor histidine kinase n=1 Tax=Streptomyces sp. MST-110588 TaxID=2833628 RepID=UPI001F5D1B23|nr:ATP-binding protein [Streptomyces sp. MST-110588]UNO40791.1 ATP-binding protein [Streptomyces sp. MST-110588]
MTLEHFGPGPDHRDALLASLLREATGELSEEFGRAIHGLGGVFASSEEARRQAQGQLIQAVGDTADVLEGRLRTQPPGIELSWEIGLDRARQQIPQAESLAAARLLFRTVTDWAMRQAAEDERLHGHSLSGFFTELNTSVITRVTEAQTWYAGYLRNEITHAQRNERARLAGDLHDRVSHGVLESKLRLGSYLALRESDPGRAEGEIARVGEMLDTSLAVIRDLIADLRSQVPDLRQALHALAADWVPEEIAVGVEVGGDQSLLPEEERTEVFLILREAVLNAVRHAAATSIDVLVDVGPHWLTATVDDDGRGIGASRRRGRIGRQDRRGPHNGRAGPGGYGITGMHERAALLGGSLSLVSRPGEGTRVTLRLPLAAGAQR